MLEPRTDREKAVLALRRAGASYHAIEDELRISPVTIRAILRRYAPALARRDRVQVNAREDEVMSRLARGERPVEIAAALGITKQTVYLIRRRPPRHERVDWSPPSSFDVQEAARLFETGQWTLRALGARYGVSHQRMQYALYVAGAPTKDEIMERLQGS